MYASFYDAAMGLNDEDFREYILALKDYALYGIEYTSQSTMVNGLLMMAQPLLEAAAKRKAKQVKNGDYGILGGRPRKGETAEEYKARKAKTRNNLLGFQTETQCGTMGFQSETLNVDVDVKEDVKDNEKVDLNVKDNENWNVDADVDVKADSDDIMSISTNTISFSFSNVEEDGYEQEAQQQDDRHRQHEVTKAKNEILECLQSPCFDEEPTPPQDTRFMNQINLEDLKEASEPPCWLGCDPEDQPTPLCDISTIGPQQPQETIIEEQDHPYGYGLENLKQMLYAPDAATRNDARKGLKDFIAKCVTAAFGCFEERDSNPEFWNEMNDAKDAYMALHGCDENKAQEEIKWALQCEKFKRKAVGGRR